jgi:hypothetical protein
MTAKAKPIDFYCRMCEAIFDFHLKTPEIQHVQCSNCSSDAEICNGVVFQEDGESFFDADTLECCRVCGNEPDMTCHKVGNQYEFSIICEHTDTNFEDQIAFWLENFDLEELCKEWDGLMKQKPGDVNA